MDSVWQGRRLLKRVSTIQFDRAATRGRTGPSFITCECEDSAIVEVVAKLSAGCEQGVVNLAREVIGACLAADLKLPVPEPFLVDVSPEWIETIPDAGVREKAYKSSPVAFGSRVMTGQYTIWTPGNLITDTLLPTAAAIFVFDAIIQNPDRRPDNPNCFVRGEELRIFDHELAFSHGLVLGWRPPWQIGGLCSLEANGSHIFRARLKERIINYDPIRAAWTALSDVMIADYASALPDEWANAGAAAASAIQLIKDARENIDGVLEEVKRVLS